MKNSKLFFLICTLLSTINLLAQGHNPPAEQVSHTPTVSSSNHKTYLKLNLLSPLLEYLDFSIERNFAPHYSAELKFGIIGIGILAHLVII